MPFRKKACCSHWRSALAMFRVQDMLGPVRKTPAWAKVCFVQALYSSRCTIRKHGCFEYPFDACFEKRGSSLLGQLQRAVSVYALAFVCTLSKTWQQDTTVWVQDLSLGPVPTEMSWGPVFGFAVLGSCVADKIQVEKSHLVITCVPSLSSAG